MAVTSPSRCEVAADVLSRGLNNVKEGFQTAKEEALQAWGDLTGVGQYQGYAPQGTGVIHSEAEGGGWESRRFSANEGWYSAAYKKYGRRPTERELYDVAHENTVEEAEASDDPEAAEAVKDMEAAKARVEALEGMDDYFSKLDTRDMTARQSLSKEAYEKVYKPAVEALQKSTEAVKKASLDSAFIFARIADTFSKRYGMPAEEVAAQIQNGGQIRGGYAQGGNWMSQPAETLLNQESKDWEAKMDLLAKKGIVTDSIFIMHTPLALQLADGRVKGLPLYMDVSKIETVMNDHPEMTFEVLKQVPKALADPIMVTGSSTVGGRIIATLELKVNGINVVVPFGLNVTKDRMNANVITSIYPRKKGKTGIMDYGWFKREVEKRLLYVDRTRVENVLNMNKKQVIGLLRGAGVRFSLSRKKSNDLFHLRVPDESDLVKLRQQNPGYYQTAYHGSPHRFERFDLGLLEPVKACRFTDGACISQRTDLSQAPI